MASQYGLIVISSYVLYATAEHSSQFSLFQAPFTSLLPLPIKLLPFPGKTKIAFPYTKATKALYFRGFTSKFRPVRWETLGFGRSLRKCRSIKMAKDKIECETIFW